MGWQKFGLILTRQQIGALSWARHTALTPTPVVREDLGVIRIYSGFRDDKGVSRIGVADVDINDPRKLVRLHCKPALDIGGAGCFDDNGVIMGDVVWYRDAWHMYYVGFQLVNRVKFLAFTGLALSHDGLHFTRASQTPVLDRSDEGLYIRAIHTAMPLADGSLRIWYAAGSEWLTKNNTDFPGYHIRSMISPDGKEFADEGAVCLMPEGDEYRIGRPRVYHDEKGYMMHATYGTRGGDYLTAAATSEDGLHWQRNDALFTLPRGPEAFDKEILCYPVTVHAKGRQFVFYNGTGMGVDGIAAAEWIA